MSEGVLTQYLKERLLKGEQILAHVNDLPKKLPTRGKIEPLGFQRVGHESEYLGVTSLGHLLVPSTMVKV